MEFGTYPTGWRIEGDLPNQVAVSTGSTDLDKQGFTLLIEYFNHLIGQYNVCSQPFGNVWEVGCDLANEY